MTQKVAAQFKKLLLARREDITRRLIQPEEVPAPILSDDPLLEAAAPTPLKAPSLDAHSQALLMEMDEALARIESGAYGECISCGKEIGTKRLVAFPCTRYCLACKSTAKPA
jgi:RNA polymerase-binding transcription factor DksA